MPFSAAAVFSALVQHLKSVVAVFEFPTLYLSLLLGEGNMNIQNKKSLC